MKYTTCKNTHVWKNMVFGEYGSAVLFGNTSTLVEFVTGSTTYFDKLLSGNCMPLTANDICTRIEIFYVYHNAVRDFIPVIKVVVANTLKIITSMLNNMNGKNEKYSVVYDSLYDYMLIPERFTLLYIRNIHKKIINSGLPPYAKKILKDCVNIAILLIKEKMYCAFDSKKVISESLNGRDIEHTNKTVMEKIDELATQPPIAGVGFALQYGVHPGFLADVISEKVYYKHAILYLALTKDFTRAREFMAEFRHLYTRLQVPIIDKPEKKALFENYLRGKCGNERDIVEFLLYYN